MKLHMTHPLEKWINTHRELLADRHPDYGETNESYGYSVLIDFAKEYGFESAPNRAINYALAYVRGHGSSAEQESIVIAAMREMGYNNTFIEHASNYVEGE